MVFFQYQVFPYKNVNFSLFLKSQKSNMAITFFKNYFFAKKNSPALDLLWKKQYGFDNRVRKYNVCHGKSRTSGMTNVTF